MEKNNILKNNLEFKLLLSFINSLLNYNKHRTLRQYNENRIILTNEIIKQIERINNSFGSSEGSGESVFCSWKKAIKLAMDAKDLAGNLIEICADELYSEPQYCFTDECLLYLQEIIKSQIIKIKIDLNN